MAAFDTVIRHGTIATASETYKADVGIRDGRIVAIGEALADADEVVDATPTCSCCPEASTATFISRSRPAPES
jgi:N-acyl-D-aspartate/D-glutamate deacylase